MADTIEQRVGIDRCQGALHTLFALTLMELAEFEWRTAEDHEWEVGRWPGLQLTLLAHPECGPHRPSFAICPLPRNGTEVPFILLIALRQRIDSSYSDAGGTSVTVFTLTTVEVQRDARSCAHRVFDLAIRLQQSHLETRYVRLNRRVLPNLPCMEYMMKIQYRFTAPMSGIHPKVCRQFPSAAYPLPCDILRTDGLRHTRLNGDNSPQPFGHIDDSRYTGNVRQRS
jgi:hypothetical protein